MALMQAIGQNTQRVFENKFRVQQAQINTGLQVASQIQQVRMNDKQIEQINQTMKFRQQEHEWEKADQDFSDKLKPLEFQAKQLSLQNAFRAQAEQRMSPFLNDIKGDFQSLIIDNPELAGEAQNVYQASIDGILEKSKTDPAIDIQTEIQKKKEEMRLWIEKKRAPKTFGGKLAQSAATAVNSAFGTSFDPLKDFNSLLDPLDKDQVSRAASVYTAFGGNPQDFAQKYDPEYKKRIDTIADMAKFGSKLSPEDLSQLPQGARETYLRNELMSDTRKQYSAISTSLQTELKTLLSEDADLRDLGQQPANTDRIKQVRQNIESVNKELMKMSGMSEETPSAAPPIRDSEEIEAERLLLESLDKQAKLDPQEVVNRDRTLDQWSKIKPFFKENLTDEDYKSLEKKLKANPISTSTVEGKRFINDFLGKMGDKQIQKISKNEKTLELGKKHGFVSWLINPNMSSFEDRTEMISTGKYNNRFSEGGDIPMEELGWYIKDYRKDLSDILFREIQKE